jgi:hypothetical protein
MDKEQAIGFNIQKKNHFRILNLGERFTEKLKAFWKKAASEAFAAFA